MLDNKNIGKLLDQILFLSCTEENIRRKSLWRNSEQAIRGDAQWHGIPKENTLSADKIPVTFDIQRPLWAKQIGFSLDRYYHDPKYYLVNYLKMKVKKFRELPDDTPIDNMIPIYLGQGFEASLFGQKINYIQDKDPWIDHSPLVRKESDVDSLQIPDFFDTKTMGQAHLFYQEIKKIVGDCFEVIFPKWLRGPIGVAMYIRGHENFLVDIIMDKELAHKILRLVVESTIKYQKQRAEFLHQSVIADDLFNDDVGAPFLKPEHFFEFSLPYERELCDFYGGIYYWHSCGDITALVPEIINLLPIELLDIGVSIRDKSRAIEYVNKDIALEIRIPPTSIVQKSKMELEAQIAKILNICYEKEVKRFVLRCSGMTGFLGVEKDLRRAREWIYLTRRMLSDFEYYADFENL